MELGVPFHILVLGLWWDMSVSDGPCSGGSEGEEILPCWLVMPSEGTCTIGMSDMISRGEVLSPQVWWRRGYCCCCRQRVDSCWPMVKKAGGEAAYRKKLSYRCASETLASFPSRTPPVIYYKYQSSTAPPTMNLSPSHFTDKLTRRKTLSLNNYYFHWVCGMIQVTDRSSRPERRMPAQQVPEQQNSQPAA